MTSCGIFPAVHDRRAEPAMPVRASVQPVVSHRDDLLLGRAEISFVVKDIGDRFVGFQQRWRFGHHRMQVWHKSISLPAVLKREAVLSSLADSIEWTVKSVISCFPLFRPIGQIRLKK